MPYRLHAMVCTGTGCVSNRSLEVRTALDKELRERGLEKEVEVIATGCNGFCGVGPIMLVQPDGIFYQKVGVKDIPLLVEEHFLKGRPYKKLLFVPGKEAEPIPKMSDIPFFGKQMLIALRNRGVIDPENIEEYIARDGYKGLAKALSSMTPEAVIEEVKASGLRGRGGGGFPTGMKWEVCRNAVGDEKYMICNCDEGDPGAFMDRSIVESDPHSVIEGMTIGAYAVGIRQGYIYVRMEYPLALKRFMLALEQARAYGVIGEQILGTDFSFDIEVHRGAGAFVCGEETALIASIEGKPGEPRAKYIYPAQQGLRDKPTLINNVETWANIPVIIERGATWFSSVGTRNLAEFEYGGSTGTKVFSLVGKVNNTGLVEVPMGITLREIIYDIGGGIAGGKRFKAVQTGGPSGGCIPEKLLDLPVDFDRLLSAGSMMGSGGMIVMDEDDCMIDVARYFIDFLNGESCGKCVPCREGLRQMREILTRICDGKGEEEDIEKLEDLSELMVEGSLCALGGTAPNPVLSTLRYFEDEYMAHIRDRRCPAGVCRALITYHIDAEKCTGCTLCARHCPVNCITGETKKVHKIDASVCIKCGSCYDACKFDAVIRQ
jgi:NADH:ubiquinone oxidoreductase subunit F (NADH-binding)/(2Fe-2S) ferredoxin/Pyruvate/2-oxoacid:ferredoxin oxidoreductase delta subunit